MARPFPISNVHSSKSELDSGHQGAATAAALTRGAAVAMVGSLRSPCTERDTCACRDLPYSIRAARVGGTPAVESGTVTPQDVEKNLRDPRCQTRRATIAGERDLRTRVECRGAGQIVRSGSWPSTSCLAHSSACLVAASWVSKRSFSKLNFRERVMTSRVQGIETVPHHLPGAPSAPGN